MDQHIKIVAILLIILGILGLVIALLFFAGGAVLAGLIASQATADEERAAAGVFGACGTIVAAACGIVSLPGLIAGWGLYKRRSWARILTIVVSIVALTIVPIGTAVGAYALWVMFNEETKRILVA